MMDGFQIVKYQQGERTLALHFVCDVDTLLSFFSPGYLGLVDLHLFLFKQVKATTAITTTSP
jgi:hypothetical protein